MKLIRLFKVSGFILVEIIVFFGFLLSCFAVVNTMVSMKYETETGDGCISMVSGDNLCLIKICWIIIAVVFLLLSIAWPIYIQYRKQKGKGNL